MKVCSFFYPRTTAMLGCYFILTICICHLVGAAGNASESLNKASPSTNAKDRKQADRQRFVPQLPKEVIVVGGGISGLAAARTLTRDRTNFTVKVFEAQKTRYGGKVWTDKLTNMKARGIEVNLGATFLNLKASNNPLVELVQKFELQTVDISSAQLIIPWKGLALAGNDLTGAQNEALQIVEQAVKESLSSKLDVSVKEAVDNVLKKNDDAEKDGYGADLVKCMLSYMNDDFSAQNYRPELLDFGFNRILLDGMGELVDRLVSGSPEELPLHIHLNKAVRQIKIDDERNKVLVRTKDGLQTQADIVIVTVPPTVIASDDLLFDPPLPKDYQTAFQDLGNAMMPSNNVIVEFELAFWPSEVSVFMRAVKTEEERGHFQLWMNVHHLIHKPFLTAFLFGKAAADFEKLSDEDAQQSVLSALIDMFGEETVKTGGKIVSLRRSNWVSDPLFRGSGTYVKVGTNPKLGSALADPLCPFVYFAGEHTSEDPGSVHGAYNSGVRVGEQILSRLCDVRMEEERIRKELEEKERRRKEREEREKLGKDDNKFDSENVNVNGTSEKKDEL